MNSFSNQKLESFTISNGLASLLVHAAREEGKEQILDTLESAFVERLRKSSIITSSVASCAIEGIQTQESQIALLVDRGLRPDTREQREVLNYKSALDYLFQANPGALQPTPELLCSLHRLAMAGSAGAGRFKKRDNQIIARTRTGDRVRFTPVPAAKTPEAVEGLCIAYNEAINKQAAPPQVCVAALVLDLTCIHPFADGNGRVSRLLMTAALLELGLRMPRLISLEEIIQNREIQYYAALRASSEGWHIGAHDLAPFLRFHLEALCAGYEQLELKINRLREPVTIAFEKSLPKDTLDEAFRLFCEIYENARMETTDLRSKARKVTISGYSSTADAETFERLKFANRFAEQCLQKAEMRTAQRTG